MVASGKSSCCLIVIILVVHQTVSLSVEELCARRCLYGRGGVLCNCNAMHFTGKRSGFLSTQHHFGTDLDTMDSQEGERFNLASEGRRHDGGTLGDVYATFDTNGNPSYHRDSHGDASDLLETSWNTRQMEEVLASLDQAADADALKNVGTDSKDMAGRHKTHGSLPVLVLATHTEDGQENDDDLTGRTKAEVASRVKLLMGAAPFVTKAEHDAGKGGDDRNDFVGTERGNVASASGHPRVHLSRLQQVLDRALQGR